MITDEIIFYINGRGLDATFIVELLMIQFVGIIIGATAIIICPEKQLRRERCIPLRKKIARQFAACLKSNQ